MPNSWLSPPLICRVPRPMETAMPNTVPTIATMSMTLPTGPWMPSPRIGWKIELTRGGRLRLWMKYAKHSAGRVKIVQVCSVKW